MDVARYRMICLVRIIIISIRDAELFSETAVGSPLHTLSKIIWCSRWFCNPLPIVRMCIALLAVAKVWLLLDIEWFVLFLQCLKVMLWIFISIYKLKCSISVKFHHLRRPGTEIKIVCVMSNTAKCAASNASIVVHSVHWLITWWYCRIKFEKNIAAIVITTNQTVYVVFYCRVARIYLIHHGHKG